MDFDIIPYDDIVWGRRLGAGSFGSVFKAAQRPLQAMTKRLLWSGIYWVELTTGSYLGVDIAIKEVLPSTEYDVHKYFEREWRIMRECRHPNIVLFLGLSKAPGDDGRVFIISEYVPRGNLRQFILSSHAFPWRLRLSFATDVARAVAYLHARQCIHRDLKGENLLLTSNERVKVTDFGFARIASRNADEMRRMTYCGTDGYMSPEIINGHNFDLPTDVFSLGIIFIEILSRKLVDSKTYTRSAPSFTPDPEEVRRRASPGCPADLVELALACCLEDPAARPLMPEVLKRLREIEKEVLSRADEAAEHVGSIRLVNHSGKRAMPSFEPPVPGVTEEPSVEVREVDGEGEDDVRKMEEEALDTLAKLDVGGGGASILDSEGGTWRTARWDEAMFDALDESETKGHQRLLPSSDTSSSFASAPHTESTYSTDVVRAKPVQSASAMHAAEPYDESGSAITLKGSPTMITSSPPGPSAEATGKDGKIPTRHEIEKERQEREKQGRAQGKGKGRAAQGDKDEDTSLTESQIGTIPSLASSELLGGAGQAREHEQEVGAAGTHRFTLVDKDAVPLINGKKVSAFASNFAFAFLRGQLEQLAPTTVKCPVCLKRLGPRPALQCDDCNVLVHVKCSHAAARNCTGGDGAAMAK